MSTVTPVPRLARGTFVRDKGGRLGQVVDWQPTRDGKWVLRTESGRATLPVEELTVVPVPGRQPLPPRGPMKRLAARWPFAVASGDCLLPAPSLADLEGELKALKAEYGANGPVKCQSREAYGWYTFAVAFTTPRIVLQDEGGPPVDLGPFRVTLKARVYPDRVEADHTAVALEPHYPAGIGRANPHPHVSRNKVCLGEAEPDFKRTMRAGLLSDAAFVVLSVLRTYNRSTAYVNVRIKDWDGFTCDNCQARGTSAAGLMTCGACDEPGCVHCCPEPPHAHRDGCTCGPMHAGCRSALPACAIPGCARRVCKLCGAGDRNEEEGGVLLVCQSHAVACRWCYHRFHPDRLTDGFCNHPVCARRRPQPQPQG